MQHSRDEVGGVSMDQVVPSLSFTEWIPVPPSTNGSVAGILSQGMKKNRAFSEWHSIKGQDGNSWPETSSSLCG